MECDLFSSLLAGAGARCFDPRTNASGMALFDDRRKKKMEENAPVEVEPTYRRAQPRRGQEDDSDLPFN